MKPLVTVITPAYNCERFIRETLDSVQVQDYLYIEHIVVDDGSTDTTPILLDTYPGPLKVIHQINAGEHLAVNRGMTAAHGDYFMIVNADDPLLPGCVSKLVDVMESNPDILCAYPYWRMIDDDGRTIRHMKTKKYNYKFMVRHHWCLPSVGSMFRSSVIEKVGYRDNQFKYVGDFDYWLRIGLVGPMMRVPVELATWRRNNHQLSGDKTTIRHTERLVLMDKYYEYPDLPREIIEVKAQAYCWACLVAAVLSSKFDERKRYIQKAFRYYPPILLSRDFWYSMLKYTGYYIARTK